MKSPPKQVPDPVAHDLTEEFIAEHARAKGRRSARSKKKAKVKS